MNNGTIRVRKAGEADFRVVSVPPRKKRKKRPALSPGKSIFGIKEGPVSEQMKKVQDLAELWGLDPSIVGVKR